MRNRFIGSMFGVGLTLAVTSAVAVVWLTEESAQGQARSTYKAPRTPDGKPNLNGIWQALGSAHWDLEDHAAKNTPVVAMGALGAIPAGIGIVEGGAIPYRPEALAKKKENEAKWLELDPVVKCYMPGVPRANLMPFPFQIVQTPSHILVAYEFASASRTIYMDSKDESPADTWMGWSTGRWDGESLVVDVTANIDQTWFDAAGNHHTDALKVTERWTATSPDHLLYEATIEDPKTFTRPWKISTPLYRRMERNAQLLEFKCVEFVEELLYGHLRKRTN